MHPTMHCFLYMWKNCEQRNKWEWLNFFVMFQIYPTSNSVFSPNFFERSSERVFPRLKTSRRILSLVKISRADSLTSSYFLPDIFCSFSGRWWKRSYCLRGSNSKSPHSERRGYFCRLTHQHNSFFHNFTGFRSKGIPATNNEKNQTMIPTAFLACHA